MIKFKDEIIKRVNLDDSRNKIIGLEIKNQRNKLQKTQEEVARTIVSISYLCKIETNSINPNMESLSLLCENVNITNDKLQRIIDLKETLKKVMRDFYWGNGEALKECYDAIEFMDNFRAQIIKMAYYIHFKEYGSVVDTISSLDKLISSMTDTDFGYYGLLKSVFEVRTHNYDSPGDVLNSLVEYKFLDDDCEVICYEALEQLYFNVNSVEYFIVLDKTVDLSTKFINLPKVLELYYKEALFYLMNDRRKSFEKMYAMNYPDKYHNTLSLLRNMKYGEDLELTSDSINPQTFISPFYYVLYLYKYDTNKFKEIYEYLDYSQYSDTELLLLQFLTIKDNKTEEYDKEMSGLLHSAYALGNTYLIELISDNLVEHLKDKARYKRCVDIMNKTKNIVSGLKELC